MINTNPAPGMRDFLPQDVQQREYVIGIIRRAYERYGYAPIDTPAIERKETLFGQGGEEIEKLVFQILKRGEKLESAKNEAESLSDLALRYDLTVPLARYFVQHRDKLPRYFKRYHIGPVWRAERAQHGRFREFYQCDVDVVGSEHPVVDAEVIQAICGVLGELGFKDYTLRINDRRFLDYILLKANIPESLKTPTLVALDKMDKIGIDGVRKELVGLGLEPALAEALFPLLDSYAIKGSPENIRQKMAETAERIEPAYRPIFENLGRMMAYLQADPQIEIGMLFDPCLIRGMSYYSGAIYEISVAGVPFSVAGGGRYDGLIGRFADKSLPAVGFSIGLERILVLMREREMFPKNLRDPQFFVTLFSEETVSASLRVAAVLRHLGYRVLSAASVDKMKKQMKDANDSRARYTLILGPDEVALGNLKLKDMQQGQEYSLKQSELADWLKGREDF
jgi:histidyl-tRNA synthetase